MGKEKVKESRPFRMTVITRGNGRIIRSTGMGNWSIRMGTSMKENGLTTKPMDSGCICIEMGPYTKVIGSITFRKVMASKHGLITVNMKASTSTVKNMGREFMRGRMGATILVTGVKTRLRVKESIFGEVAESIKGSGVAIRCMGMECIHGRMAGGTKATTSTTQSTDTENTTGRTGVVSRANGFMERGRAGGD
jgi:hypothetical protein